MAGIASTNLYDLLGNDPEQDSDREPEPPTKAIDKTAPRSGKRNAAGDAPVRAQPAGAPRGGRQEQASGNERAFRDRNAGSANNRSHAPEEGARPARGGDGGYRGRGAPRGGRGGRGGRDDRHSKTGISEHTKQAGHGWGRETGEAELTDEKAGEAIAKEEEKDGFDITVPPPVNADGEAWAPEVTTDAVPVEEVEPEIQTKSYDEYLAEVAQKKLEIADKLHVRKPNEGASKKFPEGKAFSREGEEEDFMAGSGGKNKRAREKKEKEFVDLKGVDPRQYMAPEAGAPAARGGRGRGGRGDRGGDRGDRPDRGDRGGPRGRARGGDRGRGGDRPELKGGRAGPRGGAHVPQVDDTKAFPSLGS